MIVSFPSGVKPYYSLMMHSILSILLGVMLAAVLIVLLVGVAIFVRGGELNNRWSTRLMGLRVATQAVALVTLGILLLMRSS
jgi:hypothetical protein